MVTTVNDNLGTSTAANISSLFAINVLSYGAKGDGHTDDTTAIQAAINAAAVYAAGGNGPGVVFFPPTGRYGGYKFSTLTVNGDVHLVGVRPGDGSLDFGSTLLCSQVASDAISFNSTTWGFQNLICRYYAGWANNVVSVTSSTITFDTLYTPPMATITAKNLSNSFVDGSGTLLTKYDYYTDSVDVFRCLSATNTAAPGTANIPHIASVPNDGAAHTVSGISWQYVAHGTTYQVGDFGWGQQWYFTGTSGNSITGVVPAPGQTAYTDPAQMVSTFPSGGGVVGGVSGGRGYFASLEHNSATNRGPTGTNIAFVSGVAGQDPVVKNNWFNGMAGSAIKRSVAMQGGIWTENVIDNAQCGVSGDLTNLKFTGNRVFGCTRAGIYSSSTPAIAVGGCDISGNYFQLNSGFAIQFDDGGTYTTAAVTGSAIMGIRIANNYSDQDTYFLRAKGVAHMTVEGNRLSRTARHPIWYTNVAFSRFVGNHIAGAGESQRETTFTVYNYIFCDDTMTGANNLIAGNSFTHVNASQFTTNAIFFSTVGTQWTSTMFEGNQFNLPSGNNEINAGGSTRYARTLRRAGGFYDVNCVLELFCNVATMQHAFVADGVTNGLPQWYGPINGAGVALQNTPDVSGGATAFSFGVGRNGNDLIIDVPAQTATLFNIAATVEFNNTGTVYVIDPFQASFSVNGVSQNRLTLRLRNSTTGVLQNWNTVITAAGSNQLRIRLNGRLEG